MLDPAQWPHASHTHPRRAHGDRRHSHRLLLHTRAAQILLDRGRQEGEASGRALGEATVTLRLLNRRCGPLTDATTARIQAMQLEQLEALAEALLDFSGPVDLAAWLEEYKG